MPFTIISRPFNDDFTFRMFYSLTKKYHQSASCIYLWSTHLNPNYYKGWPENDEWREEREIDFRKKLFNSIESDLVIIGVKDHLTCGNEDFPLLITYLLDLFDFYTNKKFILFTSLEKLENYINVPNVKIIPWGGDIINQKFEYTKNVSPILEKNFNSEFNFVSLNRGYRSHRIFTLALIYGMNFESKGLISCLFQNDFPLEISSSEWILYQDIAKFLNLGLDKIKRKGFSIKENNSSIYDKPNDNVGNFLNVLSNYYKNTFVEIISETSFKESCFLITEKTQNSIYGCNFPIWISSPGTVKFMRDIGLDVFDDIIDHSYDNIIDNSERIFYALDRNKDILKNKKIKDIWKNNKHRFINNVNFIKKDMYDFYQKRATTEFIKYMENKNG